MKQYVPLQKLWSAVDLFEKVTSADIILDTYQRNQYREFLLCDLRAESDSYNLYNEIKARYTYSDEFNRFLEAWYIDEMNHAAGFRKIIHLLFGEDENVLQSTMLERKADFSKIRHFFEDEFKLCVLFAYDEHASTLTYRKDTFYKSFGPPEFIEWITRLASDEARHFGNAVRLIHHKYRNRLSETPNIMQDILSFENSGESYKATFLFDHDGEHFLLDSDELNYQCANKVLTTIMKSERIV